MVYAQHLKCCEASSCGFDSRLGHNANNRAPFLGALLFYFNLGVVWKLAISQITFWSYSMWGKNYIGYLDTDGVTIIDFHDRLIGKGAIESIGLRLNSLVYAYRKRLMLIEFTEVDDVDCSLLLKLLFLHNLLIEKSGRLAFCDVSDCVRKALFTSEEAQSLVSLIFPDRKQAVGWLKSS